MGLASNARRVLKVLRSTGWFRGHRYVFLRAAGNAAAMALGGRRRLRAAELSVGSACQLHCRHCYATDLAAERPALAELRRRLDALADAGCASVLLVGGEPTLRPDLEDIIGHARARWMVPFVFSNGQRLDRARLRALRQSGLFGVLLSALGVGPRHDDFVGEPGAWERLVRALDDARAEGLWVGLNTTATRELLASGDFDSLAAMARERGITLKFNYPALMGRWSGRFDQLLGPAERAELERAVARPEISNDLETSWLEHTCPAGSAALYVSDHGDVLPCAYIPIRFGNIAEEPLAVIHERMARSPLFTARHRLCLVGEDRDFIERMVVPALAAPRPPLSWDEHPHRDELVAPRG